MMYYGCRGYGQHVYFGDGGVVVSFKLREYLPPTLTQGELDDALRKSKAEELEDINKARRAVGLPE
jgi:hypothetical protein